ncbi:MAG: hypothetical protein LCI02_14970 [Proteobacteria bacterium]|nr:hypothetical protein [Pseudomonadota bacterium]
MNRLPRRTLAALAAAALLAATAFAQPAGGPPPGAPPGAAPGAPQGAPPGAPPGMPGGGPPLPPGMPPMPPQEPVVYVAAAEIVDGRWLPADAAAQAQVQGAGAAARRALKIVSTRDRVNGLIVRGQGRTALQGAAIEINGRGKSDFDGIAAGVLVKDGATLELRGARIVTRGVVASAVTATDQATLRVLRSTLVAEGGPLPSGYTRRIGPGMMEPPTPLGISGTARTTLTMGSAKAYYADSTLIAEGWGALSTDAARGAQLEAERCTIVVRRSGYGVYADNGASAVIRHSTMDVPTFGGVIAGQAALSFDALKLKSQGNAVMIHSVMGQPQEVGTLTISGGELRSRNAAIVVKSANADITIDRAAISAGNGDLLLGVVNDDGFATKTQGAAVPGIRAVIRGSRLQGNLVHLDGDRAMRVRLEGSSLRGRIQGVELALDGASRWTATADSSVTLAPGTTAAQIDALPGVTISVKNGVGTLPAGEQRLASGGRLVAP